MIELSMSIDHKKIADYFIVVGLSEKPKPLGGNSAESGILSTSKQEPITDVCVIIPNDGEDCPPGYKVLLHTPSGLIADLNHGSIRSPEVFICYRRGRDKPPVTDIGVLYEGSERVLDGCEVVYTTPYGRPANINNSPSNRIYLTYRRASETASSDCLAVTDICVIISSKGETPPHSFCKIDKNLNRGTLMGSSVYICYKKSMCKDYAIAYKPNVLCRYPQWDWPESSLPEEQVAMFALPMGAVLESWLELAKKPKPIFSTFVLTREDSVKVYGAAVTFYESYPSEKLSEEQQKVLGLRLKAKRRKVYANRAICLLSRQPFFDSFKAFLNFLWRLSISPQTTEIPIEKYISHLMWDVPYPSPERPRVMMQLSATEDVMIQLPDDSPIPLSGASFVTMLKNLAYENCVNLLTFVLLEQKILIHSLRPAVLTGVIEAVGSMIYPFRWQCPYIPLCPLELSEVLAAPCPFIVGVDSRYFDLYDPPPDVVFIDLDTNTISQPIDKTNASHKMLPKRPTKVLKSTLEKLYYLMNELHEKKLRMKNLSLENENKFQATERKIEVAIQEAFLRFMACILKGYKSYLLPITSAPTFVSTNSKELFDMKGFIKSRDKTYHKFYEQMLATQSFTGFIEERSFNTYGDCGLDFFDECTEKVDENYDTPKLLESEEYKSDHTAFIPPPISELIDKDSNPAQYCYESFPTQLQSELFPDKEPPVVSVDRSSMPADKKMFVARRSKAEIKSSLKLASSYKSGIASSLWAKCLVANSFSLWFIHLPAFIQVSQSPHCALRAAFAILGKMQEYRLQMQDEVCYRTMMLLCGIHQLPVLAVKLLFEMKKQDLNINAITYGYYNKAVLESKWPSETSNARVLWKKMRNIILGVAQFKFALSKQKRYSRDFDSLSRDSIDSCEVIISADSNTKREDGHSTASDRGYNSMSQEDLRREKTKCNKEFQSDKPDEFRAKVGSIIKRSVSISKTDQSQEPLNTSLDSSAGLLITASSKILHNVSCLSALDSGDHSKLMEARRKRHKSAGDHLKEISSEAKEDATDFTDSIHKSENSNSIGAYLNGPGSLPPLPDDSSSQENPVDNSPKSSSLNNSLKKSKVVKDDPLGLFASDNASIVRSTPKASEPTEKSSPTVKTMEIGNLFGRESPKKSLPSLQSDDNLLRSQVKRYNLLELSPDTESLPDNPPYTQLRKSLSLESRSSYKAAIGDGQVRTPEISQNNGSTEPLAPKRDSTDSKVNTDGLADSSLQLQQNHSTPNAYKTWVMSSLKKSANIALKSNLSVKVKSIVYGSNKSKHDGIGSMSSRESLDSTDTLNSTKSKNNEGVTSSLTKIKSVSSSMYNKLKHTVKEYQAPSTISVPYQPDKTTDTIRSIGVNEDNISILSDQLGSVGIPASGPDEYTSAINTDISFDDVSRTFISRYMSKSDCSPSDVIDGSQNSSVLLEVILCTVTVCGHCSLLLYDEDIMAGWSSQDSDLNTVCRFCEHKTVPSLHIQMIDRQNQASSNEDGSSSSPVKRMSMTDGIEFEKQRVPYLSPLALRKQLENVLETEGDVSLTKSDFIDNHPIIYWNLIWYFKRMGVPSHLPQFIVNSKNVSGRVKSSSDFRSSNVCIRLLWDNTELYEKMDAPMYICWRDSSVKSSVVRALLTDDGVKSKAFMHQILQYIECSNVYTPLKLLLNARRQAMATHLKPHSTYRDMLFLAFSYFGQDDMDHDAFDREYKLAFKKLSPSDRQCLQQCDHPPTPSVIWCRKLFSALDVV